MSQLSLSNGFMRQTLTRRSTHFLLMAMLVLGAAVVYRSGVESLRLPEQGGTGRMSRSSTLSTTEQIHATQQRLANAPEDADGYALLGLLYLQHVRESGDVGFYAQAEAVFAEALERDPEQVDALVGQGTLALARHDFVGGLVWAEKARSLNPYRADILGIMVDGLVEIGRYDEAVEAAQAMVDLRPSLESFARVSYLRELHGDLAGAIDAMDRAVSLGVPGREATEWTRVQLGDLYLRQGDVDQAEKIYRQVVQYRPGYVYAQEGLAEVLVARGELDAAIEQYQGIVARMPLPEFLIALGELYEANGQVGAAQEQYELVEVMNQINEAAGMNGDLEMALFYANHGQETARAVRMARQVYSLRPTVYGADTLAWALYKQGAHAEAAAHAEASVYSRAALALGTEDAMFYFHAGMIAAAQGENEEAVSALSKALALNPNFSPLYAPVARSMLAELGAAG